MTPFACKLNYKLLSKSLGLVPRKSYFIPFITLSWLKIHYLLVLNIFYNEKLLLLSRLFSGLTIIPIYCPSVLHTKHHFLFSLTPFLLPFFTLFRLPLFFTISLPTLFRTNIVTFQPHSWVPGIQSIRAVLATTRCQILLATILVFLNQLLTMLYYLKKWQTRYLSHRKLWEEFKKKQILFLPEVLKI